MEKLLVNEICVTFSGEVGSIPQGCPITLIRLQGCNLTCPWCFGVKAGRRVPRIITSQTRNKKIYDVEVGDKLMTFDDSMSLVETTVTKTHTRYVTSWYEIVIDKVTYFVTEEHPFFTNRGLVEARHLKVGDEILHSSYKDKIGFSKLGNLNPMKRKEVAEKSTKNTDYSIVGKKVSESIAYKKESGIYKHSFYTKSEEEMEGIREKMSIGKMGDKNGNYKGEQDNYLKIRKGILRGKINQCSICSSPHYLEVHHIDGTRNDTPSNLTVLCKSCHTSIHEKGYNFWTNRINELKPTSRENFKNRLKATGRNGKVVEKIKYVDIENGGYKEYNRPRPLKVYNISCSPYNSYLVDNMWVHNCDAKQSISYEGGMLIDAYTMGRFLQTSYYPILITGGEPLLQKAGIISLYNYLNDNGIKRSIQIETNGTQDLSGLDGKVSFVVDYKIGFEDKMNRNQLALLGRNDWIKIVVNDAPQIKFIPEIMDSLEGYLTAKPRFAVTSTNKEYYSEICDLVLDKQLPIVVNLQLHKYLQVR